MKTADPITYSIFIESTTKDDPGYSRRDMLEAAKAIERNLVGAGASGAWLVTVNDPFLFGCSLVACWNAGVTPLVSSDLQPGTMEELEARVNGIVADEARPAGVPVVAAREGEAVQWEGEEPVYPSEGIALILFTSGSTGVRKEVVKTFRALFEEVANLERTYGDQVEGKERFTMVSHFHIYGLLFSVLWPMLTGRPMGTERKPFFEEVLEGGGPSGVCVIASPAQLRFLADIVPKVEFNREGSIIFSSGGPLGEAVAHGIEDVGVRAPVEVFGSTETGGVAWRRQSREGDSLFRPMPRVEVKTDERGRLLVRSPWLDDPDAWTRTGDRATVEPDGRFSLKGRFDRIAKIAGKRVSLEEMEVLLKGDGRVVDAKVFQASEDGHDKRSALGVFAVVDAGLAQSCRTDRSVKGALVEDLKGRLAKRFEPVTIPRWWRLASEFPVDSQGKVSIKRLMEELNRG